MSFDPNAAASGDGVFGLPHTPDAAAVVLVPVPFEATTSYGGGTADGPQAILAASRQVDLYDRETGRPYEAGIAMLPLATRRLWSRIPEMANLSDAQLLRHALTVLACGLAPSAGRRQRSAPRTRRAR